ncbi:DNA adenine methylase [Solibacillus silvestris]
MNQLFTSISVQYKLFRQPNKFDDVLEAENELYVIVGIENFVLFTDTIKVNYTCQQLKQYNYPSASAAVLTSAHTDGVTLHLNNLDAAWITLLVNRLAYSGIAKANSMGGKQGSVHDLTVRWNPKTLIKRIREIHKLADRIEVFCEDAVEFIEAYFWDDSATLFIDPPYFVKGKDLYNIHLTEQEHIRLAWTLQTIHKGFPSCDVIVTYDYHKFISDIYNAADQLEIIGRQYSI